MQRAPHSLDVGKEVKAFLRARAHSCEEAGFARQRIVIDPGFGFGKTQAHNLELLRRLDELTGAGWPLAVGLSRKSLVGRILGRRDADRLAGSVALAVLAVVRGARIIRAHDVEATVDALAAVAAVELGAATQATEAQEIGT
jgi:dihydropteroate synthase